MTDSDDLNSYPTGSSSLRCTTSVLGETVGKEISPHLQETKKKAKSPEIGELCHDSIQAVIIRSAHLGDTTQYHHVTYLSCLGKRSAKVLNLQVPFCSRRPKSSNSCQKRHMHREEDTIRPCRNVCFFSAFYHYFLPLPPSSFRPETPARDSCKFPSDLSALRSPPTNQDRQLHVLIDTDSRSGDCWLHVGRAM
ncbi:uncharacterized protein BDW70DRAFT_16141 [Aspergillus foveolatus]|uniref:uncharacterized protein n=1 Tax=Aspergillus foveolatus TaxID=210207 RepID=UPI003CCE26E4